MCYTLYIASDSELPLIPWDEKCPSFYVEIIAPTQVDVRNHFTKPFLGFLGSHQGCGCGFNYRFRMPDDEPKEYQSARESRRLLALYVENQLKAGGAVELYGCWDGDESMPVESQLELSCLELSNIDLELPEKCLFVVKH